VTAKALATVELGVLSREEVLEYTAGQTPWKAGAVPTLMRKFLPAVPSLWTPDMEKLCKSCKEVRVKGNATITQDLDKETEHFLLHKVQLIVKGSVHVTAQSPIRKGRVELCRLIEGNWIRLTALRPMLEEEPRCKYVAAGGGCTYVETTVGDLHRRSFPSLVRLFEFARCRAAFLTKRYAQLDGLQRQAKAIEDKDLAAPVQALVSCLWSEDFEEDVKPLVLPTRGDKQEPVPAMPSVGVMRTLLPFGAAQAMVASPLSLLTGRNNLNWHKLGETIESRVFGNGGGTGDDSDGTDGPTPPSAPMVYFTPETLYGKQGASAIRQKVQAALDVGRAVRNYASHFGKEMSDVSIEEVEAQPGGLAAWLNFQSRPTSPEIKEVSTKWRLRAHSSPTSLPKEPEPEFASGLPPAVPSRFGGGGFRFGNSPRQSRRGREGKVSGDGSATPTTALGLDSIMESTTTAPYLEEDRSPVAAPHQEERDEGRQRKLRKVELSAAAKMAFGDIAKPREQPEDDSAPAALQTVGMLRQKCEMGYTRAKLANEGGMEMPRYFWVDAETAVNETTGAVIKLGNPDSKPSTRNSTLRPGGSKRGSRSLDHMFDATSIKSGKASREATPMMPGLHPDATLLKPVQIHGAMERPLGFGWNRAHPPTPATPQVEEMRPRLSPACHLPVRTDTAGSDAFGYGAGDGGRADSPSPAASQGPRMRRIDGLGVDLRSVLRAPPPPAIKSRAVRQALAEDSVAPQERIPIGTMGDCRLLGRALRRRNKGLPQAISGSTPASALATEQHTIEIARDLLARVEPKGKQSRMGSSWERPDGNRNAPLHPLDVPEVLQPLRDRAMQQRKRTQRWLPPEKSWSVPSFTKGLYVHQVVKTVLDS